MVATGTAIQVTGSLGASPLGKRNPLWTPALLSGVQGWIDCDATTHDSATPPNVTAWPDGISSSQVFAGASGHYPTLSGSLNGHAPVAFTGTEYLATPAMAFAHAPAFVFAINLASAPSAMKTVIGMGTNYVIYVSAAGALQVYLGGSPTNIVTANGAIGAGLSIVAIYQDASDSLFHIRVNGVDVKSQSTTFAATATAGLLGLHVGNTMSLEGSIAAFTWADAVLAVLDVEKAEGYFAQRFSDTSFLPGGHPYQSAPPRRLTKINGIWQ